MLVPWRSGPRLAEAPLPLGAQRTSYPIFRTATLSRLAQQSPTLFRSAQPGGNASFKPDDTDKLGFVAPLGREIPYLLYRLCGFRVPAKLAKHDGEVEAEHIEQALISLMFDERLRLEESIQGTRYSPITSRVNPFLIR